MQAEEGVSFRVTKGGLRCALIGGGGVGKPREAWGYLCDGLESRSDFLRLVASWTQRQEGGMLLLLTKSRPFGAGRAQVVGRSLGRIQPLSDHIRGLSTFF